jgi:hypothetical protein
MHTQSEIKWTKMGALAAAALLGTGCFTVPARSSGPSERDGVQMAIVGQYCDDSDDADWEGFEAVQLRMQVSITNRSNGRLAFDPDRLRLIAPDQVKPSPVAADSPLVVAPGETKIAAVRFMNRGSLKCREQMKLDPSDSLLAGTKPVPLPPIAFVARNGS